MRTDGIQALNFLGAVTRSIFGDTKNARDVTSLAHNLASASMNSDQRSGGCATSCGTPATDIPEFTAAHFNGPSHVNPTYTNGGYEVRERNPGNISSPRHPTNIIGTHDKFREKSIKNDARTNALTEVRNRSGFVQREASHTPSDASLRGRTNEEFNSACSASSSQSPFSRNDTNDESSDQWSRAPSALHPGGRR